MMSQKQWKLWELVYEAHCAASSLTYAAWRKKLDEILKRDGIEATEEEIKCAVHRRYYENPYAFEYIVIGNQYFRDGWQFTPSKEA